MADTSLMVNIDAGRCATVKLGAGSVWGRSHGLRDRVSVDGFERDGLLTRQTIFFAVDDEQIEVPVLQAFRINDFTDIHCLPVSLNSLPNSDSAKDILHNVLMQSRGYPTQSEIAVMYAKRDHKVTRLRAAGCVHYSDLHQADRLTRFEFAAQLWDICCDEVRTALLHDQSPSVRSAAALSAMQRKHPAYI